MSQCVICGKSGENLVLFDGIVDGKISKVCYNCSLDENITLIKKPTREQLENAQKRESVREIMEKISSPQKKIMKTDSVIAHKNLNKIKFPSAKQEHGDLVQNYDWIIKQARRHKKYTATQTAQLAGIDKAQLDSLENGQLFQGFENVAKSLEKVLDVKITTGDGLPAGIVHLDKKEVEKNVVEEVKEKIKKPWWSFFKKEQENLDLPELEPVQKEEVEVSTQEVAEIEQVQQREISPWRAIRERQRREALTSGTIRSPIKQAGFTEKPIRMDAVKSGQVEHGTISLDNIRHEKEERKNKNIVELEKEIEQGKFDFSDKRSLDKIKIQDLVELKKARDKAVEKLE